MTAVAARVLDGKAVAGAIRAEVAREVRAWVAAGFPAPRLAAVLVGDDPASRVYVRNKIAACAEAGIRSDEVRLPATATEDHVRATVHGLGADPDVDGILVQLPLPRGIGRTPVLLAVDPVKDVDGLHPLNAGRLFMNLPAPVPCTPAGIIELLDRSGVAISGRHAVVVGRSDIVGRPLAFLLLQRDATVTVCHSRTRDLPSLTRQAEILVGALGRPGFLTAEHIRPGAAVIDVGINRVSDEALAAALFGPDSPRVREVKERGYTLAGDVHPVDAARLAGFVTPVPGGVGPLTIACLLRNTLAAARRRRAGATDAP